MKCVDMATLSEEKGKKRSKSLEAISPLFPFHSHPHPLIVISSSFELFAAFYSLSRFLSPHSEASLCAAVIKVIIASAVPPAGDVLNYFSIRQQLHRLLMLDSTIIYFV